MINIRLFFFSSGNVDTFCHSLTRAGNVRRNYVFDNDSARGPRKTMVQVKREKDGGGKREVRVRRRDYEV
jgi:hypothetical protein